jgi:thioredoxin 1
MVLSVNENEFDEKMKSDKLIAVDFWATWCGPCKMMSPIFDEVANEIGDKADFLKVETDENFHLAAKYGIRTVPTLMFFKNGTVVFTQSGVIRKPELISKINELL